MVDEFKNSTGYFRDPETGEDLTGNEERIVTCKSGEPFAWPMIALSSGELVKLCSRLWNQDEKQCYKEYRNGGTSVKSKKVKYTQQKLDFAEKPKKVNIPMAEKIVIKYDVNSAVSEDTVSIVESCNQLVGIAQMAGLTYALLTNPTTNKVYCVPRSLITDEKMREFRT